mgnify:FL=1
MTDAEKNEIAKRLFYILDMAEVLVGKENKDFYLLRSRILDLANDVKRM